MDFYQATVGSPSEFNVSMSSDLGGTNKAQLFVRLDREADTEKVVRVLRTQDRCAAGATAPRSSSARRAPAGGTGSLEVIVTGDDLADIRRGEQHDRQHAHRT